VCVEKGKVKGELKFLRRLKRKEKRIRRDRRRYKRFRPGLAYFKRLFHVTFRSTYRLSSTHVDCQLQEEVGPLLTTARVRIMTLEQA
jgi:hypothetical protein